jgi:MerR family mercuric resistance operon transcriptional regulator
VRKKLKDLRRIESALAGLVRDCCLSRGKVSCPLIDTLQEHRAAR